MYDKQNNNKIICLVGPTAVGKTSLSIEIAKHFDFNIIGGDSMQIYKGMDIGTGKITESEKEGIHHEMIDILSPEASFSVKDFQMMVNDLIKKEHNNNNIPFIVGGTAFYIHALINDFQFGNEDESKKQKLINELETYTNETLHQEIMTLGEKVHPNNRKRMIRVIVKNRLGNYTQDNDSNPIYDALIIGLYDDRNRLYDRINHRILKMMEDGLEQEVRDLFANYNVSQTARGAIGYHEFLPYFNGDIDLETVVSNIQQHNRNYAKRQLTYLRNKLPVKWFKFDTSNDEIFNEIERFLKK